MDKVGPECRATDRTLADALADLAGGIVADQQILVTARLFRKAQKVVGLAAGEGTASTDSGRAEDSSGR